MWNKYLKTMKNLIEDNYKSIVDRGLITPTTTKSDFIDKLFEEVGEFEFCYTENKGEINSEELADIILVCFNIAKHYDIDIEKELKNKIEINKKRANN